MGRSPLRTLGLTSTLALLAACGVRTELLDPWQEAPTQPADDAGADASPLADAPLDDADLDALEPPPLGTCAFDDKSVSCLPGDVCRANYVVGPSPFVCSPSLDPSVPCGLIACGTGCGCSDAAASVCSCL